MKYWEKERKYLADQGIELAVACGPVSNAGHKNGGLYIIDVDRVDWVDPFLDRCGKATKNTVIQRTGRGGIQVAMVCRGSEELRNQKIAMYANPEYTEGANAPATCAELSTKNVKHLSLMMTHLSGVQKMESEIEIEDFGCDGLNKIHPFDCCNGCHWEWEDGYGDSLEIEVNGKTYFTCCGGASVNWNEVLKGKKMNAEIIKIEKELLEIHFPYDDYGKNEIVALVYPLRRYEEPREIEGPDGLTYRATYVGYERQNRLPYIDFLDARTDVNGNVYIDEDSPVSGGMNIGSATNLHEELGRVITYWQSIYEKN